MKKNTELGMNDRHEKTRQTASNSLELNEQQITEWEPENASISRDVKERCEEILREEDLKKM